MSRSAEVSNLLAIAEGQAHVHQLPAKLVAAVCLVESGNDIFAWRAEPRYRYLWDVKSGGAFRPLTAAENASEAAPADFPYLSGLSSRDSEWRGQQASWGPMQVMGAVAREYGFLGRFPALCTAWEGVRYGCRHLVQLKLRYLDRFGWAGVVAAYNAGSPRMDETGRWVNEAYVNKIADAGFDGEGEA